MQLRQQPESGGIAVHYNSASADVAICTTLDTVCGVLALALDRWTTANWTRVTCRRCLRHKARIDRFKLSAGEPGAKEPK